MTGHRALEDSDLALIGRVKMTPALYDPRTPDFRLAYRKEQEWEVVASMIGLSATEARRRWTCLRDRYSRELKQLRMHPEKNEYGNSPFFRQMDFLRRFVRKRRNRRRNGYVEYEIQGPDYKKTISIEHAMELRNKSQNSRVEEDDYSLKNCHDGQSDSYANKMDECTVETDDYPEFVDVDAGDVYEECVETPASDMDIKQQSASDYRINSTSTKQINAATLPLAVMHHNPNRSEYTLSTSHVQHEMPTPEANTTVTQSSLHKSNHKLFDNVQSVSQQSHVQNKERPHSYAAPPVVENEDDLFGKSIAVYLKQLSRRHKIKAQVEMFQILEKYIELEESGRATPPNSNK